MITITHTESAALPEGRASRMMSISESHSRDVIELLRSPATHDDSTAEVQVIETHISWVFVTEHFAYKLKKAVRFDFLDFSTPTARHRACEEEVRLNRRLAPGVYLGVLPITIDSSGKLRLGSHGTAIDWVVKMRRLPVDDCLDRLIRNHRLVERQVDEVANLLARFYWQTVPLMVRSDEYRREIERHVRANRQELLAEEHHLSAAMVKRVHAAQLRFLKLQPQMLESRVCDGRIVEGHGDLRPEHVCFTPEPVIFDCIEFNAEFRRLDVADELCFLAMECDYLGAPWIGRRILDVYFRANDDQPPDRLLAFYKAYRACVRAKVAALRAHQLHAQGRASSLEAAAEYLRLADRYVGELGPPVVLIVRGLMGTGKSTLATTLAETFGTELLSTDHIRRELFGTPAEPQAYGAGRYRPESRQKVYQEMFRRTAQMLDEGLSVVLDGTFLSADLRTEIAALARRRGARPLVVECRCPAETARQRIAQRADEMKTLSDARPELFDLQRRKEEPNPPGLSVVEVDTTEAVGLQLDTVTNALDGVDPWGGAPRHAAGRSLPVEGSNGR